MTDSSVIHDRRSFLVNSALTVGTLSGNPVLGANDRIRMGFIGIGNRGSQLLELFMANPDVEVAALCDVYEPYLHRDRSQVEPRWMEMLAGLVPQMGETFPKPPAMFKDYRKLLEQKDIDAVCIATPDHWHALQTIDACLAGKDIYVEKPLTATIFEGRRMIETAARTKRVVQVGLNRRGSVVYQELADLVAKGLIGKPVFARAARVSNMYPDGIGRMKPETPPAGFDWDVWQGPRSARPYQFNMAPYTFRWWKEYSSQMGNWGVHYMDCIRWLIGERAPVAISAHGSHLLVKDDRNIPDTMEVTFEFSSGVLAVFSIHEACGGPVTSAGEIEIQGTDAGLTVGRETYSVIPSLAGQFQKKKSAGPQKTKNLPEPQKDYTAPLIRNFLDCVKSRRKVWCDLEEGHRSTCFAHLANIALEMKTRLRWDPDKEQFIDNQKANQYLHYNYRNPWKLA
jgi:predicted dehydrogenase